MTAYACPMPKRPPQGRGSGGRVTPSPKSAPKGSSSSPSSKGRGDTSGAPAARGRGRVPTSSKPVKGRSGGRTVAKTDAKTDAGSKSAPKGGASATTSKREDAVEGGGAPARTGIMSFFSGASDPSYVAPRDRERPWWGMGDMAMWFAIAQVLGGLALTLAATVGGYSLIYPRKPGSTIGEVLGHVGAGLPPSVTRTPDQMPYLEYALVQLVPLWVAFLGGSYYVVKRKGTSLRKDFGLSMQWRDIPLGLAVGAFTQIVLIFGLYKLIFLVTGEQDVSAEARKIIDKATSPGIALLIILVVVFGSPLIEELFFRGLSQRAIAKRLGPIPGLILAAMFFALVHGQLVQFPGLLLFGLILGFLALRYDRLGPSIWAHVGFNGVTAALLLWN